MERFSCGTNMELDLRYYKLNKVLFNSFRTNFVLRLTLALSGALTDV